MIASLRVPCPACQSPVGERCTQPDDVSRHSVLTTHHARDAAAEELRESRREVVVALSTLQFHWGGFMAMKPADPEHRIHLVRTLGEGGNRGDSLCGIPRFGDACPAGWSIGGGVGDPDAIACPACVEIADREYPEASVWGSLWGPLFSRPAAPWDVREIPLPAS